MKSKFDFRVSFGLIKENFKLYWYLPLLMFVFLFLCGPFGLMMTDDKDSFRKITLNFLSTFSVGQVFIYGLCTVIISLIVMGYLHKKSRALMMHAEPFTRRKLYNSNVLTGLIMLIIPVMLIALIYLILLNGQTVYKASNITYYLFSSIASLVFYYGTFVLSGVLTGNAFIQLILCGAINIVLPATVFVTEAWKDGFLTGYSGSGKFVNNLYTFCSPYTAMFKLNGRLETSHLIMYLGIGLLLLLIGNILTGFIKLEKINDILFFKGVERIITLIISFYGMSLFAFIFAILIDDNHPYLMLVLGGLVGIVLAFFITEIIINKSVKIFKKENGKFFIVILAIATIFYSLIVFDILGFSKHVPKEDKVESVDLSSIFFNYPLHIINDDTNLVFTDEDIISDVISLNKEINERDHKDDKTFDSRFDITSESISFNYSLKKDKHIRRNFYIVIKINDKIIPYIDKIVSSEKYKERLLLSDEFTSSIAKMTIKPAKIVEYNDSFGNSAYIDYTEELELKLSEEQIQEFIALYNLDMSNLNYTEWLDYVKLNPGDDTCSALMQYVIDGETYYYYIHDYFKNMTKFVYDNILTTN